MSKELRQFNLNNVILKCGVTKDVELRYIPSGTAVATLSCGFSRSYKNSNGEYEQENSYIDVVAWGKTAEACAKRLQKGSQIIAEGYLKQETWKDQNENNRSKMKIVADRIHFLEK